MTTNNNPDPLVEHKPPNIWATVYTIAQRTLKDAKAFEDAMEKVRQIVDNPDPLVADLRRSTDFWRWRD